MTTTLKYLTGYPEPLLAQVRELINQDKLGETIAKRYPEKTRSAPTPRCAASRSRSNRNT